VVAGFLVVVPIYLAILLLLKAMKTVAGLVKPLVGFLPESWPAEKLLSLLLVVVGCAAIGAAIKTKGGRAMREQVETTFFERIPGYAVIRSLTHQLSGQDTGNVWQPALIEIEEALVPGFVIEEHPDGSYTVFVPSVPTPFAGAVYVLERARVHPLDVPFTQALQTVSKWGSGAKELVAAMNRAQGSTTPPNLPQPSLRS
jgi:uncharacterized membrane protein